MSAHPRPRSRLVHTPSGPQLQVNGKPFLCLPGEVQNSSFSSVDYMNKQWTKLKSLNINTILASVSWELIEPHEDEFDFVSLDENIFNARQHGFKLILLWFGSFKNGRSTYVPPWVKLDARRFPRVRIGREGATSLTEVLSPFHEANWCADAKAYARLMEHLREVDGDHVTVIMIQVQNEPGLLGDSMDRSNVARLKFDSQVPLDLLDSLRNRRVHPAFNKRFPHCLTTSGPNTWQSVFGTYAEEAFMADALSRYVEHVASAGKQAYGIPTFVNAWLNADDPNTLDLHGIPLKHNMSTLAGGGSQPGDYPSGGACPHVMDIWQINAPSLDFLAPDVYLHDYEWVCETYRYANNPLFIPEQRRDEYGLRRILYAYLTHAALGCSPFGVDTMGEEDTAMTCRVFGLLRNLSPWILHSRWSGSDSFGFFFDELERPTKRTGWTQTLGSYELTITRAHVFGKPGPGFGFVLLLDDGSYLIAGQGFNVSFKSTDKRAVFTGIATADEKVPDPQKQTLTTRRRLNGDETMSGEALIMPNDSPDYGGFPIAITIPAETYVVQCMPYWVREG